MLGAVVSEHHHALFLRTAHGEIFHPCLVENLLHGLALAVGHLDKHGGILGKKYLHDVGLAIHGKAVGIELHAALGVAESHFEHGGDQAARAYVVYSHQPACAHKFLHSVKCRAEACRIGHRGHGVAKAVECLRKGRAAEREGARREVYVIELRVKVVNHHRAHRAADICHLAGCRDYDCAGSVNLVGAVFLRHRQRVLARGDIDAQRAHEIGASLHGAVEGGILAGILARPHPVGAKRHRRQAFLQIRAHDIRKRLGHGHHRSGGRIHKRNLRSVANRCGDTGLAVIVESHDAAVRQRKLNLALALLAGNAARYRAVNLIGQPVLAGHGFERQHVAHIFVEFRRVGLHRLVLLDYGAILHHGLGCVAKHVGHGKVDGAHAVFLLKHKTVVVRSLAYHIQRSALAVSDSFYIFNVFFIHYHAHALLALVAHDFFRRESRVANRKRSYRDMAAGGLNQLRQSVEVTACAMVMYRDYRVHVILGKGAYHVRHTLLHLRVGALHGVQLNRVVVFAGLYRRHRAAAHADAIVVATHQHDFLAGSGFALYGIFLGRETNAAGKHYHLVVGIELAVLVMLESKHRTANQRLAKLIAEVRRAVRSLDKNLGRRLVKPHARIHHQLPAVLRAHARIRRHIHSRAGKRERSLAAAKAVADFAARARGRAVERLNSRREVMRLRFQRNHRLHRLLHEKRRLVGALGRELRHTRARHKRHIILIRRHKPVGILLRRLLNHAKQ